MSVGADHETCAEGAARALSFASFGDQRRDVRRRVGEKLRLSSLDDRDGVGSWIRHALAHVGEIRGGARPRPRCLGASSSALSLSVTMIGPPPKRPPMLLSGPSPCLAASLEAAELAGVLLPAIAAAADKEHDPAHTTAGLPGRLEVSAQRLASATWSISGQRRRHRRWSASSSTLQGAWSSILQAPPLPLAAYATERPCAKNAT